MQQALKVLEQQFSWLAKNVKDLKREEKDNYEQSNIRDFGDHPMHNNQWGYGKENKREEVKESCCDISSSLNSLSSEEVNLFANSNNHFLPSFSLSVQKFEAQSMENEGSLGYKLYKTISFLPSTSFSSFDSIINESICCSFSFFCDRIQSQFLNFLTTTCGTKPNHGMEAKEEGMGKELFIG
ncbi:hypothetical protein M9H77_12740 [Catharanthus roseus]|uniref:Uncharacterized protein n=1 Tax=Catharanthus roseus TaxID=4058 RepID=A0ACC0BI86_CATRO|nr:hypothetical protein M9H77_12740 [Catharanthus roseus]